MPKVRMIKISVKSIPLAPAVQYLPQEHRMKVEPDAKRVLHATEMAGPAVLYLRMPIGADTSLSDLFGSSDQEVVVEYFLVETDTNGQEVNRTRLLEVAYEHVAFSGFQSDDGSGHMQLRGETNTVPVVTPVTETADTP